MKRLLLTLVGILVFSSLIPKQVFAAATIELGTVTCKNEWWVPIGRIAPIRGAFYHAKGNYKPYQFCNFAFKVTSTSPQPAYITMDATAVSSVDGNLQVDSPSYITQMNIGWPQTIRYGWYGIFSFGYLPKGDYIFTFRPESDRPAVLDLYIRVNLPCGNSQIDSIISEYEKEYTAKTSNGQTYRSFPLDKYKIPFVPKCTDFIQASSFPKTSDYSFKALSSGDGQCGSNLNAILAHSLTDSAAKRPDEGLAAFDSLLLEDAASGGHLPAVNSGYRSPRVNFSPCVGSTAAGSRHMFGDAVDLAVPGANNTLRQTNAKRWNALARSAGAAYTEDKPTDPCNVVVGGRTWRCVHADWRTQPDSVDSRPAGAYLAASVPPSFGDQIDKTQQFEKLARGVSWQEREEALTMLIGPLIETILGVTNADNLRDIRNKQISALMNNQRAKDALLSLLAREMQDRSSGSFDEGETEFFLRLLRDVSVLVSDSAAADLVMRDDNLSLGTLGWTAASFTGPTGARMILDQLRNRTSNYIDYLGAGCEMLKVGGATKIDLDAIGSAVILAARDRDFAVRFLAARCLQYLPLEVASPLLQEMAASDPSKATRAAATKGLATLRNPSRP